MGSRSPVLRLGFAVDCYKHSLEYKSDLQPPFPDVSIYQALVDIEVETMHEIIKRRALQVAPPGSLGCNRAGWRPLNAVAGHASN